MSNKPIVSYFEPVPEDISFSHKMTTHNASYSYHRHDACEIYLFLSGNIMLYIEENCFRPAPGSLVVLNDSEMHRIQAADNTPYDRIVINIKKQYMNRLSDDNVDLTRCFYDSPHGSANIRVLSDNALAEFLSLYRGLESSANADDYGASIIQKAYASLLLLFVNKEFQREPMHINNTMPLYITGTMQYIESHLDEPLCLSVLAEQFSVSEEYLSSQFKHHTGLTLRSYLLYRKVNCAKKLLQQGASVTEACYQSGFHDYANFIRSFKQITGTSPGKYKQSSLEHPV